VKFVIVANLVNWTKTKNENETYYLKNCLLCSLSHNKWCNKCRDRQWCLLKMPKNC